MPIPNDLNVPRGKRKRKAASKSERMKAETISQRLSEVSSTIQSPLLFSQLTSMSANPSGLCRRRSRLMFTTPF